ncbi:MAG: endonuclease/exonuclease/phosphatase family protein [Betaproteobacteria bacterium]
MEMREPLDFADAANERPTDPSRGGGIAVRVATWNIHSGVGRDGRYDPGRIVAVLRELRADVIALQEVASLALHGNFLSRLRADLALEVIAGPTLSRRGDDFGNALLTRFPVTRRAHLDLTIRHHERRGAIDAELDVDGQPLRVLSTHLGLRPYERRAQVRQLLDALEACPVMPTVLMGDVNEWYLWGRPLRWLHAHFHTPSAPATFPSRRPLFALDRIWVQPESCVRTLVPHRSPLARKASDHLPLVAELRMPAIAAAVAQP